MYSTPNTTSIRVIISRERDGRSIWYVWERIRLDRGFRWGNLKEKDHLENTSVEVRIKMDVKETGWQGVDWIYLAGSCEHGTKRSDSITSGEFLAS